jgi:hypothetical protein
MATHNWKQFRKAYWDARKKYLPYKDILGIGYERRKGATKDEFTIVLLAGKELVSARTLKGDPLPATFDGFPLDVREPRFVSQQKNRCHCDPLIIEWKKVHHNATRALGAVTASAKPLGTAVVGQVFVIEDDGTLLTTVNGEQTIDFVQAYKYFQKNCGDDYDFVNMVPDTNTGMPTVNFDISVFNDVNGIYHYKGDPNNNDRYDDRATYRSNRLQDIQVLDQPHVADRWWRLHEIGHRWGAYVFFRESARSKKQKDLLIQDQMHWGEQFNNEDSPMDYDGGYWVQDSDGYFTQKYIQDDDFAYCDLDLYLMGMLAPSDVKDFYYIDGLTPARTPTNNTRYTGTRTDLKVQNIAWAHGWRSPVAAESPRLFRQAFVVLTKQLEAGKALASNIDEYRKKHTDDFRSATRSLAVLDTYLYNDTYDDIYVRDSDSDTGEEPNPGNFTDSPDIWVRHVDDGDTNTTHQDPIRGQDNYIYVRVLNKGTQSSGEVTVNIFRANYQGNEFLYPQDWQVGNLIGRQVSASVPAQDKIVVKFKWDQNLIPDRTWDPCLLAEIHPIHRTLTQLHHVWEDRRLAQKNITIVDSPPA